MEERFGGGEGERREKDRERERKIGEGREGGRGNTVSTLEWN